MTNDAGPAGMMELVSVLWSTAVSLVLLAGIAGILAILMFGPLFLLAFAIGQRDIVTVSAALGAFALAVWAVYGSQLPRIAAAALICALWGAMYRWTAMNNRRVTTTRSRQ